MSSDPMKQDGFWSMDARYRGSVILEHALLSVKSGREAEFEAAFGAAKGIIAGMPGFRRLGLSRGVERPGTDLLLVEWDVLEDHTEGFGGRPSTGGGGRCCTTSTNRSRWSSISRRSSTVSARERRVDLDFPDLDER